MTEEEIKTVMSSGEINVGVRPAAKSEEPPPAPKEDIKIDPTTMLLIYVTIGIVAFTILGVIL